jgi:hypothetical protein
MPIDLRQHRSDITSQGGENGIIAAILGAIGVRSKFAIEFGGFDATTLSNIHPLWVAQGFTGVLIEGDPAVHAKIARQIAELSGKATGKATVLNRWVRPTGPDGLDAILAGIPAPIGPVPSEPDVLSIDIDSVDYHVWAGLRNYRPRIVLIEYNSSIPPPHKVAGSEGGLPIGCSAAALVELGRSKGYTLVACTPFNCIFVQDADAYHFADAGQLLAHYDWSWPVYVMRAFDGGLCFSGRLRSHYAMSKAEIESFAPGLGFEPPASDLAGWFRHPKRRLKRLMRRLGGG